MDEKIKKIDGYGTLFVTIFALAVGLFLKYGYNLSDGDVIISALVILMGMLTLIDTSIIREQLKK